MRNEVTTVWQARGGTGGMLGTLTQVVVDLSIYASQNVILRFRLACDDGVAATGWYIDDVLVQSGSASLPGKHALAAPALSTTQPRSLWTQLNDLLTRVWRNLVTYVPPARGLATTARTAALAAPPTGQIWRTYYFAGSTRIALRVEGDVTPANNGVFFLAADHPERSVAESKEAAPR